MDNIQVIEQNGQRVLTTQQLAEGYGTDGKVISYNFNNNKQRYEEGKHYFCLTGADLRAFREFHDLPNNLNKLYLWTERGALLHAKSLNTDKAWAVYEQLVETYFRVKQIITALPVDKSKAFEVKGMNARVRMSNQYLRLAKIDTISENYKSVLVAKAAQVLAGEEILPLPKSEQKMYSASEIGAMFGVTAQKIGKLSNANGMKTDEYGGWYHSKSKYSAKEVDTFMYNDKAVGKFRALVYSTDRR